MLMIKYFALIILLNTVSYGSNICKTPYPDNADVVINWLQSDIDLEAVNCLKENIDNPESEYLLSLLYSRGVIVDEDFDYALELITDAANKGQMLAAHDLGYMYEIGFKAIKQDLEKAIFWYKRAIAFGYNFSIDNLTGILIRQGNYEEGFIWALEGSKKGNPKSYNNLSIMYVNGLGVEIDYLKGFDAANKAAELGSVGGAYIVGTLLVSKEPGILYDENKAYKISEFVCSKGLSHGCNLQAVLTYFGLGVVKDEMKAFNIFQKLSNQDNPLAKINLADFYYYGLASISQDSDLAYKFYLEALQNLYGESLYNSRNTIDDLMEAVQNYKDKSLFPNTEFIYFKS